MYNTKITNVINKKNKCDGTYKYNRYHENCTIKINGKNIELDYNFTTYGKSNKFKLNGIVLCYMSDNLLKVQFENNCIYDFIFFDSPTPSNITVGFDDMPYWPTMVTWSHTINLMIVHTKLYINQKEENIKETKEDENKKNEEINKILNTMQFEFIQDAKNNYKDDSYFSLLRLNKKTFIFAVAYSNNCIFDRKVELYLLKKILTEQHIAKIYIDCKYNVFDVIPLNPPDIQNDILINDTARSFMDIHTTILDMQSAKLIVKDDNTLNMSIKKMENMYNMIRAGTLRKLKTLKKYEESESDTMEDETINIYHSKLKDNKDITFLSLLDSKWNNNMYDVMNEYVKQNDNLYNIEVYFCIPNQTLFMGNISILQREGSGAIYTIFDEESCRETLENFNQN